MSIADDILIARHQLLLSAVCAIARALPSAASHAAGQAIQKQTAALLESGAVDDHSDEIVAMDLATLLSALGAVPAVPGSPG